MQFDNIVWPDDRAWRLAENGRIFVSFLTLYSASFKTADRKFLCVRVVILANAKDVALRNDRRQQFHGIEGNSATI